MFRVAGGKPDAGGAFLLPLNKKDIMSESFAQYSTSDGKSDVFRFSSVHATRQPGRGG
jgi:hypothetical protein